ncbi:MAG: hypothetical protein U0176_23880 [Bacteroidia bacterium]
MVAPRLQVLTREAVGALQRQVSVPSKLEALQCPGHFLQPKGDFVFVFRLLQARSQSSRPCEPQHHEDERDQQDAKQDEKRMVEGEEQKPKHDLQDARAQVHDEFAQALLHGQRVEKPVHQLRCDLLPEGIHLEPWDAVGEFEGAVREDSLLKPFRNSDLEDLEQAIRQHAEDHHDDQDHP